MKIAYICADFGVPVFGYKGASVHVRELVAAWQRGGHEVAVFSPSVERPEGGGDEITTTAVPPSPAFEQLSEELQALDRFLGMKTRIRFDLRNLLYNLELFRCLAPRIQQERFDLIYERYTLFNYAGISLARELQLPHILEVNAPLCYEQERMRGLELKRVAQELERRIFCESGRVVVVSQTLKSFVQDCGVPENRIVVLPNAVNPRTFKADAADRDRVRNRLQINGKIVIGFVGSLKPWHGTETLIEAFERLLAKRDDVHLLLVGDGPERQALEKRVEEAGIVSRVTFTGNVAHAEVPAHVAAMDIAVAPYIPHDNFYYSPIKIFEYMALGRPVVAGAIGQVNEIVRHDEAGYLYEPGDVGQLCESLDRLAAQPELRSRLGKTGHEWVIGHRTWDVNARAILEAAERVSSERSTGGHQG